MNQFYAKLKLIFIPYLIISASIICIYTFFNWLLLIYLKKIQDNDEIVNLLIPMALPWIPLLLFFRPKLKLLSLNTTGRRNPIGGILYLNGLTIIIPLIIAQAYMITATGKLTKLHNVSEIIRYPETKYYTAKQFYINKALVHSKITFVVSGKYKSDFNMTIYAAVPVFAHVFPDTNRVAAIRDQANVNVLVILNCKISNMHELKKLPADSILRMRFINPTIVMPKYGDAGKYGALVVITKGYKMKGNLPPLKIAPIAWLAIKYTKTINNNLSVFEKNQRFKSFAAVCDTDYKHQKLDDFIYLDRISFGKDLRNYTTAVKSRGDVIEDKDPVILQPVFEPFEKRNGNKLLWTSLSFFTGAFIFLIILYATDLKAGVASIVDHVYQNEESY